MEVHRLRFIECDPQPIHCLAFSSATDRPKLAVSRGDASIEIWATNDGEQYYQETLVPGRTDTSVEALVWCGKRLFSTGLTGRFNERRERTRRRVGLRGPPWFLHGQFLLPQASDYKYLALPVGHFCVLNV